MRLLSASLQTMTSIVATDVGSPPVEYYFWCSNSYWSSGWQASPIYFTTVVGTADQAMGLSFMVKARDQSGNETQWTPITPVTAGVQVGGGGGAVANPGGNVVP